jgi:hypothetical protein
MQALDYVSIVRRLAGLRPDYHRAYYAAFLEDPEGNRVEAVSHRGE